MAVPAGPTEARYVGNGVTTVFTIPFLLILPSDLEVWLSGVEQSSGYVVTGAGNPSSTLTFMTPPPVGADIYIALDVPFERLNDYQENGDFLATTVNRDFDRIWQALKQLFRFSTRSPQLGKFDVDGQGWYRANGNGIRDLRDAVQLQDAATKKSVEQYVGSILQTGQGPVNSAANVLYTDASGFPGNLQQIGTAYTTLANTPDWYTRRVMDPIFTDDAGGNEIFTGAGRAVQGLVILDTPGGTKLYMISRTVGDNNLANERCRIVEFDYSVSTGRAVHVQFTPELAVGHGEALGGFVDGSGQVWLYTTQSNLDGTFVGANARKGFSRIQYNGAATSQTDVTSYQLFGLNGTAHELAEYNNGSVGLSTDGSKVLILTDSQKERSVPTLFIYDRAAVEAAPDPLVVRPLYRFRLRPGTAEGYGRTGIAADDQGIYITFGTAPFSDHGVLVYDWSGRFIRDVAMDDARGEYTYEQLMGGDGTIPNVFELEGAAMYKNQLHFVCLEAWRNVGDVVSFAYNETTGNFASIGVATTGIYPYDRTAFVPTNRPATSGAFNPAGTYNRGASLTTYRKRVYAISAHKDAGYAPITGRFLQRSAAGLNTGRNNFNALTYNYGLGSFRVLGWNENTKDFKRTFEYTDSGYMRLWDSSPDGQYSRYGSVRASFSPTARFVSIQGYGGDELAGARGIYFGGTDAELPGGVKELVGASSSVVVRQVDNAGEHLMRNLSTVATVLNVRRVGASGSIMKLQLNSGGDTYGEFFSSTTNFQIVARRGADLCFSNAPDEATGQTIRWRINGTDHSFRPGTDNAYSVGVASARPSVIYAGTGTINTSDAREKTPVRALTDNEISAAQELAAAIGIYQWLAVIAEKGEDEARLHIGMTVQRAIEVMHAHGLDPLRYGFICHDTWPAQEQVVRTWGDEYGEDEEGNQVLISEGGSEVVKPAIAAGDRYSFRMDELYAFIAAGQRARLDSMEARLAALEPK